MICTMFGHFKSIIGCSSIIITSKYMEIKRGASEVTAVSLFDMHS